jgi:hypothetical protein
MWKVTHRKSVSTVAFTRTDHRDVELQNPPARQVWTTFRERSIMSWSRRQADDPVENRVLEMADDLNQFFAEDIGTIRDGIHCQRLVRRRDVKGLQDDKQ